VARSAQQLRRRKPVKIGLVNSLNRPVVNDTGVTFLLPSWEPRMIASLAGESGIVEDETTDILAAAHSLEQQVAAFVARSNRC
jgi:hypothetical protein